MKNTYRIRTVFQGAFDRIFSVFEDNESTTNALLEELAHRLAAVDLGKKRIDRNLQELRNNDEILTKNIRISLERAKELKDKDQTEALNILRKKNILAEKQKKVQKEISSVIEVQTQLQNTIFNLQEAVSELKRRKGSLVARHASLGLVDADSSVKFSQDELDRLEAQLSAMEVVNGTALKIQKEELVITATDEELLAELKEL